MSIEVTRLDNDRFEVVFEDILQSDGIVYTLDRASGDITFGDGNPGTRPPSGRSGVIGAYRFGGGGLVFAEFDLSKANFPLPIAVAALLDPEGADENINFVLAGIRALRFELDPTELTVLAAEIAVIPLPGSAVLMFSALAVMGFAGHRKKRTRPARDYSRIG